MVERWGERGAASTLGRREQEAARLPNASEDMAAPNTMAEEASNPSDAPAPAKYGIRTPRKTVSSTRATT